MDDKITALYVRTDKKGDLTSIDNQEVRLMAWCKFKDINDNFEFFIDDGCNGSNINRPEMKRLIEMIAQGKINNVAVINLDRLTINQKELINLLVNTLNMNNVNFISLDDKFDTTEPYGQIMMCLIKLQNPSKVLLGNYRGLFLYIVN